MATIISYMKTHIWILHSGIVLIAASLATAAIQTLFKYARPQISRHSNLWVEAFFRALHSPMLAIVWALSALYILEWVGIDFGNRSLDLPMLHKLALILALFWALLGFIGQVEDKILRKVSTGVMHTDKTSVIAISQLSRAIVTIMLLLVTLQNFGISISALLAFGGVGGIAVGFAAKDTIANFLGGLMIFIDRPFAVGEEIRCSEQKIEGKVEHIGWRLTHIRDPESRALYVPNGLFSTMVVENLTRIKGWRIKSHLPIKIEDLNKIDMIVNEIHQFLKSNPEIDQTQAVAVSLDEIGSYSLNILILAFTKSTDWFKYLAVQQEVLTEATRIVERNQAALALPIQVNYLQTALENTTQAPSQSKNSSR